MKLELYLPEGVDPSTITVSMPAVVLAAFGDEVTQAQTEAINAQAKAALADDQVQALTQKNGALTQEVSSLKAQLDEAKKPPVIVVPPVPTRKDVWPEEPAFMLKGLRGATIENSLVDPSGPQYTIVKSAIDWLVASELINTVRFYLGPLEVAAHFDPASNSFGKFGNLIDYARAKRVHVMLDAIDTILDLVDASALRAYFKAAKALKIWAIYFNDADKRSLLQLEDDVKRCREAGWDGAIVFSLRGTAKVASYTSLGVYTEIQTFGTDREFKDIYLENPADIFCLDAMSYRTEAQHRAMTEMLMADKTPPAGYFLYTQNASDWAKTPAGELTVLRTFTQRWKAR